MGRDRLAAVTGGNRGIGRAVAARLLRSGHEVLITGRDTDALEEAAAELSGLGPVDTAAFDVTDPAAVDAHLRDRGVDVLVNNAGISSSAPVHRVELETWRRTIEVNATGALLCVQAVLDGMRDRDFGRIVTVASVASVRGTPYTAAYTASKHAVLGLTRVVAAEVAGTAVTANCVCPAYVDTAMTDRSVATITAETDTDPARARELLAEQSPLGRLLSPDEVAATVGYLASDAAAAVNGQTVVLDGGGVQT